MPSNNRNAGALRERFAFQKRGQGNDGLGGSGAFGAWETQFTVSAGLHPLRGSEAVMGDRLAGRQPYIVTVRQSSQTCQVGTDWQIVDERNPDRVFAISAPPVDPLGDRAWLEILATEGVLS
jgi:head-tail adaptor